MDDQMNQGMPGSVPTEPTGGVMPPPPPAPMGGMEGGDAHEKIMASLARIEGKLDSIAAKVGA